MATGLAGTDRLRANPQGFRATIREEICAMQFHADVRTARAPASLAGVHIGGVDVLRYRGCGVQWGNRGPRDIRADRADYYVVCLPVSANLRIRQNGADANLQPGSFTFVSTSRPFQTLIKALGNDDAFSALHVRIPGSLLRPRIPNVDDICSLELDIKPGSGRTMRALFDIALNDGAYLSEPARSRLGCTLLDAIGEVALPASVDAAKQVDRRPGQSRTLARAKAYVAARLSDPDLCPFDVAQHCLVSVRYLQSTFACLASTTVAGFIRECRLQECRAALRSALLLNRPITRIAGDWGFDDASHFSHAYRKRFGVTPREERRVFLPRQHAVGLVGN